MTIQSTSIQDLIILDPTVFEDHRGYFFESFKKELLEKNNIYQHWVQDNEAKSQKGVLRGLHYQVGASCQAKLVRVVTGSVYDVAVDIRKGSKTYGKSFGIELSAKNKRQLLVPRGFAHGYLVLEDDTIFSYKCDNYYNKESEGGILYNDPSLKINWPQIGIPFIISEKDQTQPLFGAHEEL